MLYLADIPPWWCELLAKIHETCPSAIIAGGALRDLYIGPTPKDLDIFLPRDAQLPVMTMAEGEQSAKFDDTVAYQFVYSGYPLPINCIFCEQQVMPMQRFQRFDFGICKIAFDGQQIIPHDEFLWDLKSECFTLRRCDSQVGLAYSIGRYNRLRQKYQWPMVIPSTLNLNLGTP